MLEGHDVTPSRVQGSRPRPEALAEPRRKGKEKEGEKQERKKARLKKRWIKMVRIFFIYLFAMAASIKKKVEPSMGGQPKGQDPFGVRVLLLGLGDPPDPPPGSHSLPDFCFTCGHRRLKAAIPTPTRPT